MYQPIWSIMFVEQQLFDSWNGCLCQALYVQCTSPYGVLCLWKSSSLIRGTAVCARPCAMYQPIWSIMFVEQQLFDSWNGCLCQALCNVTAHMEFYVCGTAAL
ncbi:hypothetical protein ACOMHN_016996 [Nucella lapillus]